MNKAGWTNENVEQLVKAANNFLNAPYNNNRNELLALGRAVKPFQPDPDQQLIEDIVEAMMIADGIPYKNWNYLRSAHQRMARAALDVIRKQKGIQ